MSKKIAVIGSGVSGLSVAWYLAKNGHDITIFEKNSMLGGWIDSINEKGFFFERGPRSFNTARSLDLLTFIDELELSDDISYSSDDAKKRYLFIDNKLQAIPSSLFSMFFSKLTRRHIPTLLKEPFKAKKDVKDETIYAFIERRFSKDIALKFFDPITTGIYGGNIKELSINSCFPILSELEKKYGSVIKGMFFQKKTKKNKSLKPLFTLKDGLSQIAAKVTKLDNINVCLSSAIQKITESDNKVKIYTSDQLYEYDFIIVATPYHALKNLFPTVAFDPVKYNNLTTINIGFNLSGLLPKGFGYLIPRSEDEQLLGCIFDSNIFEEQNMQNQTRLTLMLDGGVQKNSLGSFVSDVLTRHLGIRKSPDCIIYNVFNDAIAQFQVYHQEKILKLENNFKKHFSKIYLTGSYLENVSVNGCIKKSKQIAIKVESKINL